jgi:hypothetical protein
VSVSIDTSHYTVATPKAGVTSKSDQGTENSSTGRNCTTVARTSVSAPGCVSICVASPRIPIDLAADYEDEFLVTFGTCRVRTYYLHPSHPTSHVTILFRHHLQTHFDCGTHQILTSSVHHLFVPSSSRRSFSKSHFPGARNSRGCSFHARIPSSWRP